MAPEKVLDRSTGYQLLSNNGILSLTIRADKRTKAQERLLADADNLGGFHHMSGPRDVYR